MSVFPVSQTPIISFHPLFIIDPKTEIIDKRVNDYNQVC